MTKTIVEEIELMTDNNIYLLNDGSYTYFHPATGTFTAIDLSLCSPDILMEIDFMVESDSYGSDHFPIVLKIGISLRKRFPSLFCCGFYLSIF